MKQHGRRWQFVSWFGYTRKVQFYQHTTEPRAVL